MSSSSWFCPVHSFFAKQEVTGLAKIAYQTSQGWRSCKCLYHHLRVTSGSTKRVWSGKFLLHPADWVTVFKLLSECLMLLSCCLDDAWKMDQLLAFLVVHKVCEALSPCVLEVFQKSTRISTNSTLFLSCGSTTSMFCSYFLSKFRKSKNVFLIFSASTLTAFD